MISHFQFNRQQRKTAAFFETVVIPDSAVLPFFSNELTDLVQQIPQLPQQNTLMQTTVIKDIHKKDLQLN